jgi:hypothetical protein
VKMGSNNCESENVTCQDIKIELEIELHQTKEAIEKTEVRLRRVEIESKQKLEKLQNLKSKVNNFSSVLSIVTFIAMLTIIVSPVHHRAAANTFLCSLVFNQGQTKVLELTNFVIFR